MRLMVKNVDMVRFLKLLFIIPAVVLLFACSATDDKSTAVNQTTDSVEEEARQRECWQAAVIRALYNTAGRVAMNMYGHLTKGAMALMMVAFALWLAFRIMKHVSSFTEESPAEVWTEVMKKFFICFACGWLATSTTGVLWVLNSIVFPVYNAFLELAAEMLRYFGKPDAAGSETFHYSNRMLFIPFTGEVEAKYQGTCAVSHMDPATMDSFPQAPLQMMECLACAVNERLNFGYKLGWVIITQRGFMALICGLIMMLLFTFIKLGFVFYLVDSIFRFAVMVMLMPILIMAYAFKKTQEWTITGFKTILNSAAFMLCIAVVILIAMAAIQQILLDNREIFENRLRILELADFSKPMLMLMLVGFLLVESMGIAQSIADDLVGGGGKANFQKQFGSAVAKVGKWAAVGILRKVGKGTKQLLHNNSKTFRKFEQKVGNVKNKQDELADDGEDD